MNEMDTDQNGLLRWNQRRLSPPPFALPSCAKHAPPGNGRQQPRATGDLRHATADVWQAPWAALCRPCRPRLRLSLLLCAAPGRSLPTMQRDAMQCSAMRCKCGAVRCKCSHEELKVGLKRIGLDVDDKKFDQVRRSPLSKANRTDPTGRRPRRMWPSPGQMWAESWVYVAESWVDVAESWACCLWVVAPHCGLRAASLLLGACSG
jgi:hypothetical protein